MIPRGSCGAIAWASEIINIRLRASFQVDAIYRVELGAFREQAQPIPNASLSTQTDQVVKDFF